MPEAPGHFSKTGRRLNHVEFVYRPGEKELVISLIEALGCGWYEVDAPPFGSYIVIQLDDSPHGDNDMFVSLAEPEQLALENALDRAVNVENGELANVTRGFRRLQKTQPYRATHVGIRMPSVAVLDEVIDRLESLRNGKLASRLEPGEILNRSAEEASAMSAPVKQIWFWTDVISTGLLTVGQQFELQAYEP